MAEPARIERTERDTERDTEVNESRAGCRVDYSLSAADEGRIQQAVCKANRRPYTIFGLVLAGIIVVGVVALLKTIVWVGEIAAEQIAQGVRIDSAGKHTAALATDVVRQPQLHALQSQMQELQNANRALAGTVREVNQQQARLSSHVSTVSSLVLAVENRVGEEQKARSGLMEAIDALAQQLREPR